MIRNSNLGLTFPACNLENKLIKQAEQKLHNYNINLVTITNQLNHNSVPFRASAIDRAKELNELFKQNDINAIICARGGFGAQHITNYLDYHIIKRNPKLFIGYSDITILLNKIFKETGIITYHGIMLKEIAGLNDKVFFKKFQDLLRGKLLSLTIDGKLYNTEVINGGVGNGRLVGGNLTSICATIATDSEIEFKNNILFLEDIDEEIYQIDRLLTMLNQTGKINETSGIILGGFTKITNKSIKYKVSLESLFRERLKDYKGPIISNYPAGHENYTNFLPIGRLCKLVAGNYENNLQFI